MAEKATAAICLERRSEHGRKEKVTTGYFIKKRW